MNRTEFLTTVLGGNQTDASAMPSESLEQNPVAARKLIRTTTGLGAYTGPWTAETAAHLLRRTMFGPRRAEIQSVATGSMDAIVDTLLAAQLYPPPAPEGPGGTSWVNLPYDQAFGMSEGTYRNYLKAWWMGLMVKQGFTLVEKMTLFWHNLFPSEAIEVQDSRAMYKQNVLFRQYALGNFLQLVRAVSVDHAMLVYLNGYRNTKTAPDENYARELLELFTIGKGPQIADGNYTNYTEQDVKAAAKVLTGYRLNGSPRDRRNDAYLSEPVGYRFVPELHDTTNKQFSEAFQNRVIVGKSGAAGEQELDELLDMIFDQPETARFICRKLYRWFVYYDIDASTEQNVIEPMALLLRDNNFDVKPVLSALLKSEHFYDANNIGCFIRTPVDLTVGAMRQLNPQGLPDLTLAENYQLARRLVDRSSQLQMNVFDPPDVAGWKAFYQLPDFYELWINTTTLPTRGVYTDELFNGIIYNQNSVRMTFRTDPIAYAKTMSAPNDPFQLVDDIAAELSPIPLTDKQKETLLYDVLQLAKNSEYEWTNQWDAYNSNPNNTQARDFLTGRLNTLLKYMLRLAEAQLA
ncbi:MAG TPA: DUF1800 domain-containing protein [Bacteroidota bacterium]